MDTSLVGNTVTGLAFYKQQFEGHRLQHFVDEEIPFIVRIQYPVDDILIADTCEALDTEADVIKKRLTKAHFRLDPYQLEKYVQYHQHVLMELSGDLLRHAKVEQLAVDTGASGTTAICRHVYTVLQDLLSFLETNLSSYYDNEAWILPQYRIIRTYHFKKHENTFHHKLTHYKIDQYLVNIIFAPIHSLITDRSGNNVTWNMVTYLHELQEHILKFAPAFGEADKELYALLLSVNFNSHDYYRYVTSRISQTLHHLDNDTARLDYIYDELQTVTQHTTRHAPLDKDLPSLTDMLKHWLDDQAALFERKLKFRSTTESTAPDQMIYPTPDPTRLPLPMAVEIIAYWISLITRAYNIPLLQREIVELIVNLFTSKRTGTKGIAAKSLSNAISKPESRTINAVEQHVTKIARFIRDDKHKPQKA